MVETIDSVFFYARTGVRSIEIDMFYWIRLNFTVRSNRQWRVQIIDVWMPGDARPKYIIRFNVKRRDKFNKRKMYTEIVFSFRVCDGRRARDCTFLLFIANISLVNLAFHHVRGWTVENLIYRYAKHRPDAHVVHTFYRIDVNKKKLYFILSVPQR